MKLLFSRHVTQTWRTTGDVSQWLSEQGILHHVEWEMVQETEVKHQFDTECYQVWDYRLCINQAKDAVIFRLFYADIPLCTEE